MRFLIALAASLLLVLGCSDSGTSGGTGGVGGADGRACPVSDYCSPCPTAEDTLMILEERRESTIGPDRDFEDWEVFWFCDGRLARYERSSLYGGTDQYFDASGSLVGVFWNTDSDLGGWERCAVGEYSAELGITDSQCEGVLTREGPCFGVPCIECSNESEPGVCDLGNECASQYCAAWAGVCVNEPRRDGSACEGGECVDGVCTPVAGLLVGLD